MPHNSAFKLAFCTSTDSPQTMETII